MRKIFCFGNEFFDGDEVAKQLSKQISNTNFEFIQAETPTEILSAKGEIIILDVAKGITEVKLLKDTKKLQSFHSITCHDMDLNFFLKLMVQTKQITNVKIIALPFGNKNYIYLKQEVEKILETI